MQPESPALVIDRHNCHLLPSAHDGEIRSVAVENGDVVIGLVQADGKRAQITLVAVSGLRIDSFTTQNVLFELRAIPLAEVPLAVAVDLMHLPPQTTTGDPTWVALRSSDAIYVQSQSSWGAAVEAICARAMWRAGGTD